MCMHPAREQRSAVQLLTARDEIFQRHHTVKYLGNSVDRRRGLTQELWIHLGSRCCQLHIHHRFQGDPRSILRVNEGRPSQSDDEHYGTQSLPEK
jgi:hypothetical protein